MTKWLIVIVWLAIIIAGCTEDTRQRKYRYVNDHTPTGMTYEKQQNVVKFYKWCYMNPRICGEFLSEKRDAKGRE